MVVWTANLLTMHFLLLDELVVNAADNFHRDPTMSTIKVVIDQEANLISVWNNGRGIPIEIHKELGIYVPEMIFGKCLMQAADLQLTYGGIQI